MSLSKTSRALVAGLAATTLIGVAGDAFARNNQYMRTERYDRSRHYRRNGLGAGPAIAGAALGVAGLAAAGIAANRRYNGYPAYDYGDRYSPRYGYDYVPDHGYYGPY